MFDSINTRRDGPLMVLKCTVRNNCPNAPFDILSSITYCSQMVAVLDSKHGYAQAATNLHLLSKRLESLGIMGSELRVSSTLAVTAPCCDVQGVLWGFLNDA